MMKNAAIRYDFLTNTLYVTKSYLDKAGIFGSPEYKEIKKYRDDNAPIWIRSLNCFDMKFLPFHVFGFPVQLSKVILIDSLFSLCFPVKSITPINFYTSPNNK